jgi:predicted ATPase/DNA-binding CsgD family transcriptional regulator
MASECPLIGRERDLSTLEGTFSAARILTVIGPGGCGKTRLALELARRVRVAEPLLACTVVQLAEVRSPDGVLGALLHAFGAREPGRRSSMEVVTEILRSRPTLVLLDNCEHLRSTVGTLVTSVTDAISDLRVLVTSREPLGISDETVFMLGPLSLPDPAGDVAAVVRSDAGRMFVDRAVASEPTFALTPSTARAVTRICHDLDGLPLALGLAAARVRGTSLDEIAEGLSRRVRLSASPGDNMLSQHRSLRASLDWSYQLLNDEERNLLRSLSTFAGGWTVPEAHAVALPEADETDVHQLIGSLEEKGLIYRAGHTEHERWAMLQTVGDYASEQLESDGEKTAVEQRHIAWFRTYAAEADLTLMQRDGHGRFDEEAANLKVAIDRAAEYDPDSSLSIVASLTRHWILAERFEEARAATARALLAAGDGGHRTARAVAHFGTAVIGMLSEDYPVATDHAGKCLSLLADVEDTDSQALCLQLSGMVLILTGLDVEEGLRATTMAVELLRPSRDRLGLAWALVNVAFAAGVTERFEQARAAYDEFMSIPGAPDHVRLRTWAEQAMAWTEVIVGSPSKALRHAELSLELEGEHPSMTYFQGVCHRIHALARMGRADEAVAEAERMMSWATESRAMHAVAGIELGLTVGELMGGELDAAQAHAQGLLEKMPQLHTASLMREVLATIALVRGDASEARAQAGELEEIAAVTESSRLHALSDFFCGCAALVDDDLDQARENLQAALMADGDLGLERGAIEVLEELALLAAHSGDLVRTARISGATSTAREQLCAAPLPTTASQLRAAKEELTDRDGASAWEAAWEEGTGLSLADAIAYARRARGRRGRPATGWRSLTPTEIEVARLASSGISNPEMASRLLMSRSTVKMHLSSIYFKLHVANRTELARVVAERSAETVAVVHDLKGAG